MSRLLRQISRGTGIGMGNLPENLQEVRDLPENLPEIRDLPENLPEIRVRDVTSTSPPVVTRPAEETLRRDNQGTYSLSRSLSRAGAHECVQAPC